MASAQRDDVSIFYRRDRFDPGSDLFSRQRDEPVGLVRDFWLYQVGEYWMVTRHADVRHVLGDAATFGLHDPDRPPILPDELSNMDPPEHTRLRRILMTGFTPRRIRQLAPRIERIVTDHLDAMAISGPPADIVADFALPVPSLVISELLGVPYADRAEFQQRTRTAVDLTVPMDDRMAATRHAHDYLAELVARKRRQPEDDLISAVLRENGDAVTDAEIVGASDLILAAGHETTANTIALGTLLLLEHPGQANRIRVAAADDPVLDTAIEEIMRYLSVVATPFARIARRDVELGGALIREGDYVICQLPVANRDSALGAGMDRFDIEREPVSHVSFGHGIHHCLGAPLARVELRIAFPALLRRFPGLRSALPPDRMPYRTQAAIYGLDSLPVRW